MDKWVEWGIFVIGGLIAWIWKDNKNKQKELEIRLQSIENKAVTKDDFSEFKKENKNDLAELKNDFKDGFNDIMKTLNGINDKVVTREVVRDISRNEAFEALNEHQNKCPFVRSILNKEVR